MEMIKRMALAKKRRTKYLEEYERTGWTIAKLAKKHNVSPARMAQLLTKAQYD